MQTQTATRPTLSATQIGILIGAAQRNDGLLPVPTVPVAPRGQIARKFLRLGLAERVARPADQRLLWMGNEAFGLRITDAGRAALAERGA